MPASYNLPKLKKEMHLCTCSEPVNWISSQEHRTTRHPSGVPSCAIFSGGAGRLLITPGVLLRRIAAKGRSCHCGTSSARSAQEPAEMLRSIAAPSLVVVLLTGAQKPYKNGKA